MEQRAHNWCNVQIKELNEYLANYRKEVQTETSEHQNSAKMWQEERKSFEESVAKLDQLVGTEFCPKKLKQNYQICCMRL